MKRLGVEGAGGRRKKRKATQDGGVNKESSDEREREKKKGRKIQLKGRVGWPSSIAGRSNKKSE